jgi:predicted Zn-dependent protease with MMP-like domain
VVLAGLAFPLMMNAGLALIDGTDVPPTLVGLTLFVLVFGVSFLIVSVAAVDAHRFLERAEERRAVARARARRAATRALPFELDGDTFAGIVEEELAALPSWVRERLGDGNLNVELDEQDDDAPFVLGTFRSVPVAGSTDRMLTITLYRLPLIRNARLPERMRAQVRATLLHEVGHFFGMTEDDLDRYEIGNRPRPDAARVRPLVDLP